jgi:hypothetical protein
MAGILQLYQDKRHAIGDRMAFVGEVQKICFGHPKLDTGISIEPEACGFLLIVIAQAMEQRASEVYFDTQGTFSYIKTRLIPRESPRLGGSCGACAGGR